MKCDKCDRPATVHVKELDGGKHVAKHLCEDCAANQATQFGPLSSDVEYNHKVVSTMAATQGMWKRPTSGNREYFTITTTLTFHAGHQLRLYDGSLEPLHEHDWKVTITVGAVKLDSIGVVMDFHELTRLVREILAPFEGRRLNDLPPFADDHPSAERVAQHIAEALKLPQETTLSSVEVWETPENSAIYRRF